MAALDWPFCPLTPVTESLQWATEIMRTKATEQRVGLRRRPRRAFVYSHLLTDEQATTAKGLVRAAQGADGFNVPDWTNAVYVGAVSSGNPSVSATIQADFYNDKAFIWESVAKNETVSIASVSASGFTASGVVNTYARAYVMPAFSGDCPEGIDVSRSPANNNSVSAEFVLTEVFDLSESNLPTYRSADLLQACPVVGGGAFSEGASYPVSGFANAINLDEWVRSRNVPDVLLQMRWHLFDDDEIAELIRWLHSRQGRLKYFWLSSFGKDLIPATNVSGTTLTVFTDNGIRTAEFDLDIKDSSGNRYQRQVTAVASGSQVNGRATSNLTLDSSLSLNADQIERISFLRAARLNTDLVELQHAAKGGVVVSVPCIEVPEP